MSDAGKDPIPEIKSLITLNVIKTLKYYGLVQEKFNFINAKQLGCHIITVPPSIIEKL